MEMYPVSEQYKNLFELLENPEFANNPDVLKALHDVGEEFQEKGVQAVYRIKNAESEIKAISAEIKRLAALKKVRLEGINRLREHLKANMEITGIHKIECPLFKITLSKPSLNTVEITDEQALPVKYLRTKIEPDRDAIKEALKNGEYIDGAHLVETRALRIK